MTVIEIFFQGFFFGRVSYQEPHAGFFCKQKFMVFNLTCNFSLSEMEELPALKI